MSRNSVDYPGRMVKDSERTAFGLGWEYKRRGWTISDCPIEDTINKDDFLNGFNSFKCSDPKTNAVMLRGFVSGEY